MLKHCKSAIADFDHEKLQSENMNTHIQSLSSAAEMRPFGRRLAGVIALSLALACACPAVNVTTQKNDTNRSGLNSTEATLTPGNVNQAHFGKLFEKAVDGDIYSQPLYVQSVSIGGGTHNVVYISTMNNTLYAFDADNGGASAFWTNHLATAVPQGDVQCCCTDVQTVIGVNSTGVIDLSTNTWYVVDKQKNADATYHQFLHAIDITTGAEKFSGPREISGSSGGITFNAKINNQRSSLLLQGGNIYFGCASHNDCGDYHGFIFGYSASTLNQVGIWVGSTSSGAKAGVWMDGGGCVGDGTSVFCTTGNGNFNVNTGGTDVAMSAVRLNSTLARQDYFTPHDWSSLSGSDLDLAGGQSAARLWGSVSFSSASPSPGLRFRRRRKRLPRHQTEAIPASTPLRVILPSTAKQPAAATRPPVFLRSLASQPAATTRPPVLMRSLASQETRQAAAATRPPVLTRSIQHDHCRRIPLPKHGHRC